MLQPGYGDAGGVYGLQGTGARAGALFVLRNISWLFIYRNPVIYTNLSIRSFFVFQLDFRRWVFFRLSCICV